MNTCRGQAKFKNFRILLDSGYSSTIVITQKMTKLKSKEDDVMQWNTNAGNIITNI